MYINHNFFIQSSVDGHLGSFHNLAMVENAAINIVVQVPYALVLLYPMGKFLAVLLLGHRVDLFLIFWGTSTLFSRVAARVCIPTNSFSTSSPISVVSWFVHFSHSDWREVVSECGFDLYFPDEERRWASFHVPVGHLDALSIHVFCPCLTGLFVFWV